jgi:hypothetical protein
MKTKTWFIYPNCPQPYWDSNEQKLVWIDSGWRCLDLPVSISTQRDAENFLKQSYLKERGTEYVDWSIREY